MEISVEKKENSIRFTIVGEVDEQGAEVLKKKFRSLYTASLTTVTFDFKNVTHIGSAGIGKLLLFYKDVALNNGTVGIEHIAPEIFELFLTLKLETVFLLSKS